MKKLIVALCVFALASVANAQTLEGSFPAEGGAISVTAVGGDVAAAGLDFNSAGGNLVPAPGGAEPFTFFLSNTANQVTYGNLGSSVTFADGSTTELSVGAAAGADDITGSWGMGATPVAFEVTVAGGGVVVPVVDLTGLSPIFAPSNAVWGGAVADGAFTIGGEGFVQPGNNWPGAEGPENAINGIGQKYLNFQKEGSAFLVTPDSPSVASALRFWAANDAVERDPAGYEIWGTNSAIDASEGFLDIADFTAISTGDILLPDSRNDGGDAALDEANSFTVGFDNADAYSSYLVVFPSLKDSGAANSMQIADVQAYGQVVPEPATGTLVMMAGLIGLCFRRRR